MNEVFVVTHGDYSDYAVACVFEREEDAAEYVRLANLADVRGDHELWHNSDSKSGYAFDNKQQHLKSFEQCEECRSQLAKADRYGAYRVERFAFHPAGEIPHGDSNAKKSPE